MDFLWESTYIHTKIDTKIQECIILGLCNCLQDTGSLQKGLHNTLIKISKIFKLFLNICNSRIYSTKVEDVKTFQKEEEKKTPSIPNMEGIFTI